MIAMGDGWLAERAAQGDEAAFVELMNRYEGLVRGQAASAGLGWADVEEVTQDAWLDAFRNLNRFDPSRQLGPWLRGICRNRVRKFHRDVAVKQERYLSLSDRAVAREAESMVAGRAEAESKWVALETLLECAREMSGSHRRLLYLHYLDDLPIREVAARLGRSRGYVSQTLFRARRALRSKAGLRLRRRPEGKGRNCPRITRICANE